MKTGRMWVQAAGAAAALLTAVARAGAQPEAKAVATIPNSIKVEHQEIHADLERAAAKRGPVGNAARQLAAVLHPHFVREEQIALPPLGLLVPLSRGTSNPEMRAVLPMTDSLRSELPRMLEEHRAIRAATLKMEDVARRAHDTAVVQLAEKLKLHAQSEEEVFYPAAVLVGDLVRGRTDTPKSSIP